MIETTRLNPHTFPVHMNNMGGQAFRSWDYIYMKDGVFVGFNAKHEVVEMYSSEPRAEWRRGCQNARVLGNPLPQSDTAKLLSVCNADPSVRGYLREKCDAMWRELEVEADKVKAAQQAELERKHQEAEAARLSIVDAWKAKMGGGE